MDSLCDSHIMLHFLHFFISLFVGVSFFDPFSVSDITYSNLTIFFVRVVAFPMSIFACSCCGILKQYICCACADLNNDECIEQLGTIASQGQRSKLAQESTQIREDPIAFGSKERTSPKFAAE